MTIERRGIMKRLKNAVLKIDKDWFMYFIGRPDYNYPDKIIENGYEIYNPILEWPSLNEWIVNELEHEIDLYEGDEEEREISWIKPYTYQRVKKILDNYYDGKYIKE